MSHHTSIRRGRTVWGLTAMWTVAGAAIAADRTWTSAGGGTFSDTGNWQSGLVPGALDNAIFGLNSTYTVSFTSGPVNAGLKVRSGDVTLSLAGFTYSAPTATIGEFSMQTGRLTIQGGTLASSSCAIGLNVNSAGFVTVSGAGAAWNASQFLTVGNNGAGTFTVTGGGTAIHLGAGVGFGSGIDGSATVTGAGSVWQLRTGAAGAFLPLTIGQNGDGALLLDDDGLVRSSTGTLANNSGSSGSATVRDGADWIMSDGPLTIGAAGAGDMLIESGGQATVQANVRVGNSVSGDGELIVRDSGSRLDVPGTGAVTNITIGGSGQGMMFIQAGGVVAGGTNIGGVIGQNAGSFGFVEIDGAGSQWTMGKDLLIGNLASGALNIQNGGAASCRNGTIGAASSVSVVGAGSSWSATGSSLTVGAGSLLIHDGGACVAPALSISAGATVLGNLGTIQAAVTNSGTLRPGVIAGNPALDLGSLAIQGAYTQPASGTLPIDINGLGFGPTTHDSVGVTGAAILDGTIAVSLIGGIEPAPGTAFDVLTASSVSGTFATETLPPLSGGKFFDVVYEPTRVRVLVRTNCPADLDGDGSVGAADLALLLGAWGTAGGPADLDGSGVVGSADLALLLGAWGRCP